ncbi:MAG TPA: hypothetical protein VKV17_21950 [Bryobacteraceae bacterium]|nr:hypothetical protein [Bryobacteraceae bacterium]
MRSFQTISIAVTFSAILALGLTGCVTGKKRQARVETPPPPAPKPVQEAPARPQPLSIPQTQAQLPAPQPISPEALATVQSPPQTTDTQPSPGTNNRPARRSGPVAGPKPEPAPGGGAVAAQGAAAQAAPPAVAPPDEPRVTVQEIVPPAELKRLQESVGVRQQEIRKVLEAAQARHLTYEQRGLVARIQSFLQQSEDAQKRNDWRQANALADRALVLAKELAGADQ